jgi:hypothetical protein
MNEAKKRTCSQSMHSYLELESKADDHGMLVLIEEDRLSQL